MARRGPTFISCVAFPPNSPKAQQWWNCDGPCESGGLSGTLYHNNTLMLTCPAIPGITPKVIYYSFPANVTVGTPEQIRNNPEVQAVYLGTETLES